MPFAWVDQKYVPFSFSKRTLLKNQPWDDVDQISLLNFYWLKNVDQQCKHWPLTVVSNNIFSTINIMTSTLFKWKKLEDQGHTSFCVLTVSHHTTTIQYVNTVISREQGSVCAVTWLVPKLVQDVQPKENSVERFNVWFILNKCNYFLFDFLLFQIHSQPNGISATDF